MIVAVVAKADGMVRNVLEVSNPESLSLNMPEDCDAVPCGDVMVQPGRMMWTGVTFAYVVHPQALPQARMAKWARVKAARDVAEWGGCSTLLGRVDTDPDSQRKTSGAVQMAMIAQAAGAPFTIPWTMQDNTTVEHDAQAMIQLGVAVGQHVAACHAAALVKRAALDAATSLTELDAVDPDSDWPDAPVA